MTTKRFLANLVALFAALALPGSAASVGLGLSVTPAKLEMSMPIGSSYNVPLTVSNGSATPVHILASLADFTVTSDGSYEFLRPGSLPDSLMRWGSINPLQFDLAPGTTQQVRLTLHVPDGHYSGEYAGIVFFQTRPVRRAHAVAFSARVATKIYVTIPGTVRIDGAIVKMATRNVGFGQLYRVLFKNTGNAHVYLRGQIQVQREGQTVEQIALPSGQLVERNGERWLEAYGRKLPPGKYAAIATIDYGGATETGGEIVFEVK
jgi:hypothetical protein